MRANSIQSDFTSGELSPRLIARADVDSVKNGVKKMRNAYPLMHGGARRRIGTTYVDEVSNSDEAAILIPYTFSRTVSYICVFNNDKIQFIKNGAFILDGPTRYEVASPYSAAELDEIDFTQLGASLILVHPNHPPRILKGNSDTNWTLTTAPFEYYAKTDADYENYYLSFRIIQGPGPWEVGDKITINSSTSAIAYDGLNNGDGKLAALDIRPGAPAETWTLECVYTDDEEQKWTVEGSVTGTMTALWHTGNYPKTVTVHDQRLWFGGTSEDPQVLWSSKAGSYLDLTRGVLDADAIKITLVSDSADEIVHLMSSRSLLVFSYGTEFAILGGAGLGITPTSIAASAQTFHGAASAKPIRVGNEVIFIQRGKRIARAISYAIEYEQNVAPNISVLAEHITDGSVKATTFQQTPDYIGWFIQEDGTLLSLSHLREYDQTGWAKHTTDGWFEECKTIPGNVNDVTYFVVKRTIDGNTKRYIESFNYDNAYHSDACITLHSAIDNQLSGLDHLEGKTVDIVIDGMVHPQRTVSAGTVELLYSGSEYKVGLHYDTEIEMFHPVLDIPEGTSLDRDVFISRIIVKVQDTIGGQVNGVDYPYRRFGTSTDQAVQPFTGNLEVNGLGWSDENTITIKQVLPLPFTVLSVNSFMQVND
jgi:hypothetical protein